MTSKAEELWEKYAIDEMVDRYDFLAALREYGAAVRKKDAELCLNERHDDAGNSHNFACEDCAAAIEREELP